MYAWTYQYILHALALFKEYSFKIPFFVLKAPIKRTWNITYSSKFLWWIRFLLEQTISKTNAAIPKTIYKTFSIFAPSLPWNQQGFYPEYIHIDNYQQKKSNYREKFVNIGRAGTSAHTKQTSCYHGVTQDQCEVHKYFPNICIFLTRLG